MFEWLWPHCFEYILNVRAFFFVLQLKIIEIKQKLFNLIQKIQKILSLF